jgi:WD40 repeat protein
MLRDLRLCLLTAFLATGGAFASSAQQPTTVSARLVWQSESPPFAHRDRVGAIAYSPDGLTIVTCEQSRRLDNSVLLWDAETGQLIRRLVPEDAMSGGMSTIAFSPDGKLLVGCWGARGHATIWDTATWQARPSIRLHDETIFCVKFLPDNAHFVTGGADGRIRVTRVADQSIVDSWDFNSASPRGEKGNAFRSGSMTSVMTLDVASDGRIAAAINKSGSSEAVVCKMGSEKPVLRIDRPNNGGPENGRVFHSIRFSPDGSQLISGGARLVPNTSETRAIEPKINVNAIRRWNAKTGALIAEYLSDDVVGFGYMEVAPNGQMLATVDEDVIHLWRLGENRPTRRIAVPERLNLVRVCFAPDSKRFAAAVQNGVKIWDTATGEQVAGPPDVKTAVTAVAWSRDGGQIGVGRDGSIEVWNVAGRKLQLSVSSGEPVAPFNKPPAVYELAFSPNGAALIAAVERHDPMRSPVGAVRVWEVATAKLRREIKLENGFDREYVAAAFAPNGRQAVLQTLGLALYDVADGKQFAAIPAYRGGKALQFSPDGRYVHVATLDGEVFRWNPEKNTREAAYRAEWKEQKAGEMPPNRPSLIIGAVFSPDGRTLVTSHRPGTQPAGKGALVFWDNELGQFERVILDQPSYHLAISPDGRRLAGIEAQSLGGANKLDVIHIWDVETARELFLINPGDAGVTSMAFSPDSRELLAGFDRGTFAIWDVQ